MYMRCGTVSCTACTLGRPAGSEGVTLSVPHLSFFRRHAQSEGHLQAVATLTGCTSCLKEVDAIISARDPPPFEEFEAVWGARRRGHVFPSVGTTCVQKAMQMKFCIAECFRTVERDQLMSCTVLVTHHYAKGRRHTIWYVGVDDQPNCLVKVGRLCLLRIA